MKKQAVQTPYTEDMWTFDFFQRVLFRGETILNRKYSDIILFRVHMIPSTAKIKPF